MYTQRTAALRATKFDSNIINAKKLLIYPGSEDKTQRKDILEIINKISDDIAELKSKNYALYKEMTEKLINNGIYHLNEIESINFALEEELDDLFFCEVVFTSGTTPTVVTSDSRIKWVGDDVNAGLFTPITNTRYSCTLQYDGVFVRGMAFGIPTV